MPDYFLAGSSCQATSRGSRELLLPAKKQASSIKASMANYVLKSTGDAACERAEATPPLPSFLQLPLTYQAPNITQTLWLFLKRCLNKAARNISVIDSSE